MFNVYLLLFKRYSAIIIIILLYTYTLEVFNMDINKAKEKIAQHNENIKKEKEEKQKLEEEEYNKYFNMIRELQPRIENIIEIGNMCVENNIKLNSRMRGSDRFSSKYRYNEFITDGIYHYLGFYPENREYEHFTFIGYKMGGACGGTNFITNGEIIASTPDYNRYEIKSMSNPLTKHMKKFVKDFPEFEKTFYKFVDNL